MDTEQLESASDSEPADSRHRDPSLDVSSRVMTLRRRLAMLVHVLATNATCHDEPSAQSKTSDELDGTTETAARTSNQGFDARIDHLITNQPRQS